MVGSYDLDIKSLVKMLTNSTNCNKIILYNINGNNSFEYLFKKLNIDYNNITIPTSNKSFSFTQNEAGRHFNKNQQNSKYLLNWLELHRVFPHCNLSEEYIFKISRDRKQANFISKMNSPSLIKETIKWPRLIESIQDSNNNFLQSTKNSNLIVLN